MIKRDYLKLRKRSSTCKTRGAGSGSPFCYNITDPCLNIGIPSPNKRNGINNNPDNPNTTRSISRTGTAASIKKNPVNLISPQVSLRQNLTSPHMIEKVKKNNNKMIICFHPFVRSLSLTPIGLHLIFLRPWLLSPLL